MSKQYLTVRPLNFAIAEGKVHLNFISCSSGLVLVFSMFTFT